MQGTNVRGPSGECAVASVEARVRSRINIWNCKRKSNKQLGPLKELLGTLEIFTTIIALSIWFLGLRKFVLDPVVVIKNYKWWSNPVHRKIWIDPIL